jgi:hypothetical protein
MVALLEKSPSAWLTYHCRLKEPIHRIRSALAQEHLPSLPITGVLFVFVRDNAFLSCRKSLATDALEDRFAGPYDVPISEDRTSDCVWEACKWPERTA